MNSELKIYKSKDGNTEIIVKLEDDTVWLNLNQMAELFQRDKSVVSRHITNIYKEKELLKESRGCLKRFFSLLLGSLLYICLVINNLC